MKTTLASVIALGVICVSLSYVLADSATSQPTTAPASGPASMPASAPAKLAATVELNRTGGFIGTNDHLTIEPSGAYKCTGKLLGKHEGKLDPATMKTLADALYAANIKADSQYKAPSGTADGFHYTLKYDGHTVTWEDMAELPKEIKAVADSLRTVLANIPRKEQ